MSSLKSCSILVYGDLIRDTYLHGKSNRISQEAPVPVVIEGHEENRLGGAGNVAANIAALGGIPVVAGLSCGETERLLRDAGIDPRYTYRATWRVPPHKVRVIANNQQVCRIDREDTSPIHPNLEATLHGKILEAITSERPSAVIISDYNKGTVTKSLFLAILEIAASAGIPVFLDPKPDNADSYPNTCHFTAMTPNVHEAEQLSGVKIRDITALEAAGRTLMLYYGCKYVVITRGELGMAIFWSEGGTSADVKVQYLPAEAKQVFDVSGAGDTVIATLALAYASGIPMVEAAAWANKAAGIAVGKPGTATVSLDELEVE